VRIRYPARREPLNDRKKPRDARSPAGTRHRAACCGPTGDEW
jgi:hypothetical protein